MITCELCETPLDIIRKKNNEILINLKSRIDIAINEYEYNKNNKQELLCINYKQSFDNDSKYTEHQKMMIKQQSEYNRAFYMRRNELMSKLQELKLVKEELDIKILEADFEYQKCCMDYNLNHHIDKVCAWDKM